jgi:hypothetical protein
MILKRIAVLAVLVLAARPALAQSDSAKLVVLNRGYVDAFMHSDAEWYDAHLAPDYLCFAPDGSIISRADFVRGAKQPMRYTSFGLDSVVVKLVGDIALVSAITPFVRADGTKGVSRYTDTWVKRDGVWKTLRAQITPVTR